VGVSEMVNERVLRGGAVGAGCWIWGLSDAVGFV
jgi:hypothetical protein